MGVELFDHLRLVALEIFLAPHRHSQQYHLACCHNLIHLSPDPVKQGVIKEFVANADSLTLVESLQQMIQATILERCLKCCKLVLACVLEFAE